MTIATLIGIAALGIPMAVVFALMFRRQRLIRWFAYALLVVGLGYLASTGAAHDIGQKIAPRHAGKSI